MAAETTLPQSLNFLTDAAHLLATTSPETSAYLMTQRSSLVFENDVRLSDLQREHVCGCCGHIMILGQGDTLRIAVDKPLGRKRGATKKKAKHDEQLTKTRKKRYACGMCGRYTEVIIPPAPSILRRPPKPSSAKRSAIPSVSATSTSNATRSAPVNTTVERPSVNASSKKRAKSRKQGLQALLQQSSSNKPQTGLGVSLSDFLLKK